MKTCALMSSSDASFTGTIELTRFMKALTFINFQLTKTEVWLLVKVSNFGSIEIDENQKSIKCI